MTNSENTLSTFAASASSIIDPREFFLNLCLATIMSLILAMVYRRLSPVIADRSGFARNFFMLATVTLMIISVVKSSLALSLGLVGALSIIRFRSAIKDPEELTFIFLSMAIGLGLGANQRLITCIGFLFIIGVYSIRALTKVSSDRQIYHLVISSNEKIEDLLDQIVEIVSNNSSLVKLKRMDQQKDLVELTLSVQIDTYDKLKKIQTEINSKYPNLNFSFMDLAGLLR